MQHFQVIADMLRVKIFVSEKQIHVALFYLRLVFLALLEAVLVW